jgi:hypothetical protein
MAVFDLKNNLNKIVDKLLEDDKLVEDMDLNGALDL